MIVSDALMDAVNVFYSSAKAELGDEFGGEQALAMFDALHPEIRGAMLMTVFAGDSTRHAILQYDATGDQDSYISAIKALRQVFGWELRTAKSAVDMARDLGQYDLGVTSREQRMQLTKQLIGSAWHI